MEFGHQEGHLSVQGAWGTAHIPGILTMFVIWGQLGTSKELSLVGKERLTHLSNNFQIAIQQPKMCDSVHTEPGPTF